ncbi:MAG: leader peptide processing enzyme [Treponema sp.]|nr:leader peptide processing enzyme [Treponema sp.]
MNKKLNTFFFVLAATAVNLVITIIVFFVLLMLFLRLIAPHISEEAVTWGSMLIFILAIALAFIIYQVIIKLFAAKVDMHKYFDPIFAPKNRFRKKD